MRRISDAVNAVIDSANRYCAEFLISDSDIKLFRLALDSEVECSLANKSIQVNQLMLTVLEL